MKYSVAVLLLVALCEAQRPPYAGPPRSYPAVLPRFAETTAAPKVDGRVDVNTDDAGASTTIRTTTTTTTTTTSIPSAGLPFQAMADPDLYNMIKTWPKEKQPFWYINSQKIAEHLNPSGPQTQPPTFAARSFFAG